MEHLKKNLKRLEQRTAQTVGRAEKTDVLAEVEGLGGHVERMLVALQQTRGKLVEALRTKGGGDNHDKRRRKTEEAALVAVLKGQSEALSTEGAPSLLGELMGIYGSGLDQVLDELVKAEREMEERALPSLGKFSEEERSIKALREKLSRAVLDMDSAKRRLQANKEPEKQEHIQDEYDQAEAKVTNCRDHLILELHQLSGKEVEMAQIFNVIMEIQLEYFRTATATLEGLLPRMQDKVARYPRRPVYGCPLEDHLRYSGRSVALVLEVCCCALVELGLKDEGLFRVSGNALKLKKLKAALDAGTVDLSDYDKDPHSIAGSLKAYLRDLPDPLMTHNLHNQWRAAAKLDGQQRVVAMQRCLQLLPRQNLHNLRYLVKFLAKVVTHQEHNKMTASNVAIVFGPNLFYMGEDQSDSFIGSRLVETLINHCEMFFPEDVRFSSSLIGSLHDRSGGFTVHGPIISAYASTARHSPPQATHHAAAQPRTSPPSRGSASPVSQRALDKHPSSRRPKAPAPPPPPNFPQRHSSGSSASAQPQISPNPQPTPVSLYPNPHTLMQTSDPGGLFNEFHSGPPSKASSAADSLNEYGAEESLGTISSSGYGSATLGRPLPSLAPSPQPPSAALAAAESLEAMPPPTAPPGHRKTASLDQAPRGVSLVHSPSPSPNGVAKFPSERELDGLIGRAEVGGEHPSRPPPPSKEDMERSRQQRHSLVLDVTADGGSRLSLPPKPQLEPKPHPEPLPRKTLAKPTHIGLPPSPAQGPKDGRTRISVEETAPVTSPDSPSKPKPPLPVKPKLDPEMTHL